MNLVLRYSCLAILFVSGIISCKKPSEEESTPNAGNLRISRIVQDVASAPGGHVAVTDFIYDDQKRIQKINYSGGDSVNGGLIITKINGVTFYYNGIEKNPYKTSGQSPDNSYWTAEAYFFYNSFGELILDSIRPVGQETNYKLRNYNYSSDRIIVKRTDSLARSVFYDSLPVKNHNLTGIFYNITRSTQLVGYQCTYDNKINPLSLLNIAAQKTIEGVEGFPMDGLAPGYCQNNIKEYSMGYVTSQGEFVKQLTRKFSFTYTKEGLPEKCVVITERETYIFNYYYKEL